MTSLVFDSYWHDLSSNNINPLLDVIKVMFVTVPGVLAADKKMWTRRSSVVNEVQAVGGYVAGGFTVICSSVNDLVNDRNDVTLGGFDLPNSNITAAGAVYYKSRGGDSSLDELIAMNDFGEDLSTANGTFTLAASTLRIQN